MIGNFIKEKGYEKIYHDLISDPAETIAKFGVGKIDGHRNYPIDHLIIHHSAGSEKYNYNEIDIQDRYDTSGKLRGYESVRKKRGTENIHSFHSHPNKNKETYSQYNFACYKYDIGCNPYGWKIIKLMRNPIDNVAWHCGNWHMNRKSIGIVICGTYTDEKVDENALLLIADSFKYHSLCLKSEYGKKLEIKGHRDFHNTACPGRIYEQLDIIRQRIG